MCFNWNVAWVSATKTCQRGKSKAWQLCNIALAVYGGLVARALLSILLSLQCGIWLLILVLFGTSRPSTAKTKENSVEASTRIGMENVVCNALYWWCGGLKPRIVTKRLTQTGKWNEENWTKRKRTHEANLLTLLHVPKTKGRAHRLKATEDWTDYEHALNIKQENGFTWQELMRTREWHDYFTKTRIPAR